MSSLRVALVAVIHRPAAIARNLPCARH